MVAHCTRLSSRRGFCSRARLCHSLRQLFGERGHRRFVAVCMPIRSKSATARRPAPCALFLSSSPTIRATARTKATASAERRPDVPAEALSQRLARRPGAGPREYALLQLPAGMQNLVHAACRLAHAAPGSDERCLMDQSWRARLHDVDYARLRPARSVMVHSRELEVPMSNLGRRRPIRFP